MALLLYIVGFIVLIAGLAWAATLLGVPSTWIVVGAVVVAGIAILSVATGARQNPPAPPPPVDR